MLELRTSTHRESMTVAVGYGEIGASLPSEMRVLHPALGELVAEGITDRLASAEACEHQPVIELDALVAHAERILAASQPRGRRSWSPDERQ